MIEKMARFKFSASSSLIRGEGRFISDQDWSFSANEIGSNVGCNPLFVLKTRTPLLWLDGD